MATLLTSYDIVGKKEDVSDVISNISNKDAVFQSLIGAPKKVHNTMFSWQEDVLAPPNLNNAAVDGAPFVDVDLAEWEVLQNYTQIMTTTVNVAETTDAIATYGRAQQLAYEMGKKATEIKLDYESIMLSGQTKTLGSSTTPRTMDSFQAQVDATLRFATGAANTSPTLDSIKLAQRALYGYGSRPNTVLINYAEVDHIATFQTATTGQFVRQVPNSGAASTGLVDAVDFTITGLGRLDYVPTVFGRADDYLIFSPKNWEAKVLRPWTRETLAKTSDSTRMSIVGEYSLAHKNKRASAVIRKTTGTNGFF